jgi:hypothetical protein
MMSATPNSPRPTPTDVDITAIAGKAVLDLRSQGRVVGSLWRHRPAVISWLRHFGCLFCKQQAAQLRSEKARIEALGARLAFVGQGSTKYAIGFQQAYAPDCEIYTDPSRYTYEAIGARDSVISTVAGVAVNGLRAMREGYFQTSILGNPFQQGGVLIALPGDHAAYVYLSRIAGDHPPVDEVMNALRQAVAPAGVSTTQPSGVPFEGSPASGLSTAPRFGSAWPKRVSTD